MTDKMKFSYGGLGAGVETEIVAPKIQNKCPKCNLQMDLVEGVGLINSDFHTLKAKCHNCGYSEEFSDYRLISAPLKHLSCEQVNDWNRYHISENTDNKRRNDRKCRSKQRCL